MIISQSVCCYNLRPLTKNATRKLGNDKTTYLNLHLQNWQKFASFTTTILSSFASYFSAHIKITIAKVWFILLYLFTTSSWRCFIVLQYINLSRSQQFNRCHHCTFYTPHPNLLDPCRTVWFVMIVNKYVLVFLL